MRALEDEFDLVFDEFDRFDSVGSIQSQGFSCGVQ
jgi:hypothetical protein